MKSRPASDAEIYEALHRAFLTFCPLEGETEAGRTALRVVMAAIVAGQFALVAKMDQSDNSTS